MDWLKTDALRLKEDAEHKIMSKDYVGARDSMNKASQICPTLENISQMLDVCNILCASEMVFPGFGIDWYWVIQLHPSANDENIKAQYQKFSSHLIPLKNNFPGTDLALKFIFDACSVLLDRKKRLEYDSKRIAGGNGLGHLSAEVQVDTEIANTDIPITLTGTTRQQIFSLGKQIMGGGNAETNGTQALRDFPLKRPLTIDMDGMVHNSAGFSAPDLIGEFSNQQKEVIPEAAASAKKPKNVVESRPLRIEAVPDQAISDVNTVVPNLIPKPLICTVPDPDVHNFDNNRGNNLFEAGQIWAAYDSEALPRKYARIDKITSSPLEISVTWLKPDPIFASEKRWSESGLPVACGRFVLENSNMTLTDHMFFSHVVPSGPTKEGYEIYPKKGDVWAIYKNWDIEQWSSKPESRAQCEYEMVEILTNFSKATGVKVAYLEKVEGFRRIYRRHCRQGVEAYFQIPRKILYVFSHSVPAFKLSGLEMEGVTEGMLELDPLSVPENVVLENFSQATSAFIDVTSQSEGTRPNHASSARSLVLPSKPAIMQKGSNADVQYYKRKWSAKDFAEDQIWAIYDGSDKMPRVYVKINNVSSPNKVSVTYLDPHPMHDDEIQWVEENLPFVCGIFRAGRATVDLEMSKFSHLVKCERSVKKSFYKIYPKESEIWALYQNWNNKWKLSDHKNYQIQVVEILSDFNEEVGTRVSSLVEVKGCVTFFERRLYEGFELTKTIPRTQMLSFSHRIPAYTVPGIEAHGIPKGSWHLEPDALPESSLK